MRPEEVRTGRRTLLRVAGAGGAGVVISTALGALPAATAEYVQHVVTREWGQGLIRSWNSAGWITLSSRVGKGTVFRLELQPTDARAAAERAVASVAHVTLQTSRAVTPDPNAARNFGSFGWTFASGARIPGVNTDTT